MQSLPVSPLRIPDGMVPGGTRVQIGLQRDPFLPEFYQLSSHPLLPKDISEYIKRIFVYLWDPTNKEFIQDFLGHIKNTATIPEGPNDEIKEKYGLLELCPGDVVFARDISAGSVDAEKDVLQAWIVDLDTEMPKGLCDTLRELRDKCLGPRTDRTSDSIAYERGSRCHPVQPGGRTFSFGLTHQRQRALATPSAGGKLYGDVDSDLELRRDVVKNVSQAAVYAVRSRAPEIYRILNNAAELFNTPRIGTDDNCLFGGCQMNIASAVEYTSRIGLAESMDPNFGGKHVDDKDDPAAFTAMISCPDLPEKKGYEGGRFHLIEFGAYVRLEGLIAACFSGLRYHGGTPPRAPKDQPVDPSAYRWVMVMYPQRNIIGGNTSFNIGAKPDHTPLQVTPDMRNTGVQGHSQFSETSLTPQMQDPRFEAPSNASWSNEANFAMDGQFIMEPQSLLNFMARATYQIVTHTMRQMPWPVTLDANTFLAAYTANIPGIEPALKPKPWPLASDGKLWTDPDPMADSLNNRQRAWLEFNSLRRLHGNFIPSIAQNIPDLAQSTTINKTTNKPPIRKSVPKPRKIAKLAKKSVKKGGKFTLKALSKARSAYKFNGRVSKRLEKRSQIANQADKNQEYLVRSIEGHRLTDGNYTFHIMWMDGKMEWLPTQRLKNCQETLTSYIARTEISLSITPDLFEFTNNSGNDDDTSNRDDENHSNMDDNDNSSNTNDDYTMDDPMASILPPTVEDDEMSLDLPMNADIERLESLRQPESDEDISSVPMEVCSDSPPEINSCPDIAFLSKLSLNSLVAVQKTLVKASEVLRDSSCSFFSDIPAGLITEIDNLHKVMEDSTLLNDTAARIPRGWELVQKLTDHTTFADAEGILQKQLIMMTHLDIYLWLRSILTVLELNPRKQNSDEQLWIVQLLVKVDSVVKNHFTQDTVNFDSSLYLPNLPARTYMHHQAKRKKQVLSDSSNDDVCTLAAAIIRHWLQFPSNPHHAIQTKILNLCYQKVENPSIFLLDEIWRAYSNPTLVCKVKRRTLLPSKSEWERLNEFFERHPFFQNMQLAQALKDLDEARTTFLHIPREPRLATSESDVPLPLLLSSPPNIPTAPIFTAAPFLQFLLDLYPLIKPGFDPKSVQLSLRQKKVLENMDYYLPFRECGPSRRRILRSSDGPFSPSQPHQNRRGVLFSALIFRGITFGTPALKIIDHSGFFANLEEWDHFYCSPLPKDFQGTQEEFFCNPKAYGVTNLRSTSNAALFWNASEVLLNFLENPDRNKYPEGLKFLDIVKHIAQAVTNTKKQTYFTFGPLAAYLLAVDLVYANQIPTPTVDEMGDVIEYLDKGAVGGLRIFKLFGGTAANGAGEVFKEVYSYLNSMLTDAQKEVMHFDVFMVEHGLCKGKQLLG